MLYLSRIVKLAIALFVLGTFASMGVITAAAPTAQPDEPFVYIPTNAAVRGPLQILVTIHGMGGNGPAFCQNLINRAEQEGWVIVSPTFTYQDYRNPDAVRQDDTRMLPYLKQFIDTLPQRTGLQFKERALLYGFSRGAQMVQRFAEFYPERTLAVALFAAGSYTLPLSAMAVNGTTTTLNLPYGVADLQQYTSAPFNLTAFRQISFFIGVGGADGNPQDTPRAWDPYIGQTRIARAQAFQKILTTLGLDASIIVFPNVGHDVTNDMRGQAMGFLEQQAIIATVAQQNRVVTRAFLSGDAAA